MKNRLLTNYIIILILSSLVTGVLAFYFMENSYMENKEEKLLTNVNLIEKFLNDTYKNDKDVNFFKLAQDLSKQIGSRVTFINMKGIPIADSLNNSIIFNKENMALEYRYAAEGESLLFKRYSNEVGEKYFYLAKGPIMVGNNIVLLRLGDSYNNVDIIIEQILLYLVISLFIGICFSIIVSYISIGKIVKPIKELTLASKLIANGNFNNEIVVSTDDEIGELSVNFNIMRIQLKDIIDEMKEKNRELDFKIKVIKRLENMRKEFVANVSHELRTPLTSITGFVETLKINKLNDEDRNKALNIIEYETERLKRLIDELLDLSKIENINNVKELKENNLKDIVLDCINLLEPQISEKNLSAGIHIDDNLNPIKSDKELFKQMCINLIDNSIKYNNYGGYIRINLHNYNGGIKLVVEDNGIGIPEDDLERIFERFYRVDKSRSNANEGTGLGLSIVKHIVLCFGGTVNVESKTGNGTKFTVLIPGHN